MKVLNTGEAMGTGWKGLKNNWLSYVVMILLYIFAAVVQSALSHMVESALLAGLLSIVLSMFVQILLIMIVYQLGLQIALQGGDKVSLKELELSPSVVVNYILTHLLMLVLCVAGLAVLVLGAALAAGVNVGLSVLSDQAGLAAAMKAMIVPLLVAALLGAGLLAYFMLTYSFSLLTVLHQGLTPWAALAESKRLSQGARGDIFIFFLATIGVLFLGACCLLVGVIPAAIVVYTAWPAAYLSLLDQSGPRV